MNTEPRRFALKRPVLIHHPHAAQTHLHLEGASVEMKVTGLMNVVRVSSSRIS